MDIAMYEFFIYMKNYEFPTFPRMKALEKLTLPLYIFK